MGGLNARERAKRNHDHSVSPSPLFFCFFCCFFFLMSWGKREGGGSKVTGRWWVRGAPREADRSPHGRIRHLFRQPPRDQREDTSRASRVFRLCVGVGIGWLVHATPTLGNTTPYDVGEKKGTDIIVYLRKAYCITVQLSLIDLWEGFFFSSFPTRGGIFLFFIFIFF